MGIRVVALSVVVSLSAVALAGCGGGDGDGGEDAAPTGTTAAAAPTSAAVTPESFRAGICAAGATVAAAKPGPAGGYALIADSYAKTVPTADKKPALESFVAANRSLATLWSDPKPITTEAFSTQQGTFTDQYLAAAATLQVECPQAAGVTTTVAAAATPAVSRLYAVVREVGGKGLWWYSAFGCEQGKKLQLGPGVSPIDGEEGAGAILDEAAGAADPFTGVLANESYGRVGGKLVATCA